MSVVLPVRDGEGFLAEALESVLTQTLRDFELIVIDDGSVDATPHILDACGDARLRVLRQERLGLVEALNRGVREAHAPYLARMDADDVSLPERLERQAAFLEAKSGVALVVPGVETIDAEGGTTGRIVLPPDDASLRRRLLLRNPFTHGAVMVRREALLRAGSYRPEYGANEDYDLWRRVAAIGELAAIPDVLYRYREHAAGVTKGEVGPRVESRERLRDELWRDQGLLRALAGRDDPAEMRALAREALRRRRVALGLRLLLRQSRSAAVR